MRMTFQGLVKTFWTLIIVVSLLAANVVHAKELNTSYVEEIQRQWNYLNELKTEKDKTLKKKSRRLLQAIEKHLYANSVQFEVDSQDSTALLIKVLSGTALKEAHPLNRFATSLYQKYAGLRVEISPLKLKVDQAGALFDDETNRLTLAYDNVVGLKADSFVGHELIHARFYQLERKGEDHVYMGWLKRKENSAPLQETYPDAFSLDELAAYYYQCLTLLHEAQIEIPTSKDPSLNLSTAKDFIEIAQQLVHHLRSDEISQFTETYLNEPRSPQISFDQDSKHDIVRIETQKYILELNFSLKAGRRQEDLVPMARERVKELRERAKIIDEKLDKAHAAIDSSDPKKATEILSSARDLVLKK